jgi:iron complex transport system substrate-binding protein
MAAGRTLEPEDVVAAAPEVVLASWCGKPFDREAFISRPGFGELPAVRSGRIHEIDPAIVLQPGPAALTAGLDRIAALLAD